MTINFTEDEKKEITQRARQDQEVIMSFYDAYAQWRRWGLGDRVAAVLALARQQEVFRTVYQQKQAEYQAELQRDYRVRLELRQKWQSGRAFRTRSGIRVRSKIEKIIADFLFSLGLRFVYEPILDLNGFCISPDFHLPDYDLYLEHFGLDGEDYRQSAAMKLDRYRRAEVQVISTYPADEPDIEDVLAQKLRSEGVPVPEVDLTPSAPSEIQSACSSQGRGKLLWPASP
jgi:hypothetical protein